MTVLNAAPRAAACAAAARTAVPGSRQDACAGAAARAAGLRAGRKSAGPSRLSIFRMAFMSSEMQAGRKSAGRQAGLARDRRRRAPQSNPPARERTPRARRTSAASRCTACGARTDIVGNGGACCGKACAAAPGSLRTAGAGAEALWCGALAPAVAAAGRAAAAARPREALPLRAVIPGPARGTTPWGSRLPSARAGIGPVRPPRHAAASASCENTSAQGEGAGGFKRAQVPGRQASSAAFDFGQSRCLGVRGREGTRGACQSLRACERDGARVGGRHARLQHVCTAANDWTAAVKSDRAYLGGGIGRLKRPGRQTARFERAP